MSHRAARLSRRNFLLAVGAGSAATAAAVIAGKRPATPSGAANTKRATAGYQDSPHVRSYYRSTKV